MDDGDSITKHLSTVELMKKQLSDEDENVTNTEKIAKVLGSFPNKFNSMITAWDSCEKAWQTYDNLSARLLKEELRLSQMEEAYSAFAALQISKPRPDHGFNNHNTKMS